MVGTAEICVNCEIPGKKGGNVPKTGTGASLIRGKKSPKGGRQPTTRYRSSPSRYQAAPSAVSAWPSDRAASSRSSR